jgi:co-chaperonin GroES (HSP10)
MSLKPWNRRLLVELIKEEVSEQHPQILLPENYKPKEDDPHVLARVVACASDATQSLQDQKVVLQSNGVETFKVNDKTNYLVLENYVVCVLEE